MKGAIHMPFPCVMLIHRASEDRCVKRVQVAWPASYHFADVERLGAFQMAHLRALGIKDPQNWPQAKIAATEQGWNVRICLSF